MSGGHGDGGPQYDKHELKEHFHKKRKRLYDASIAHRRMHNVLWDNLKELMDEKEIDSWYDLLSSKEHRDDIKEAIEKTMNPYENEEHLLHKYMKKHGDEQPDDFIMKLVKQAVTPYHESLLKIVERADPVEFEQEFERISGQNRQYLLNQGFSYFAEDLQTGGKYSTPEGREAIKELFKDVTGKKLEDHELLDGDQLGRIVQELYQNLNNKDDEGHGQGEDDHGDGGDHQ